MIPTEHNISRCHRCPLRQRGCNGACACTVDGRDIVEHAQANRCPHPDGPRFGTGEPIGPPLSIEAAKPGPGDYLDKLIKLAGYTTKATCGCADMRQHMNAWGVRGCWRRRQEIIDWLVHQAKKHDARLPSPDLSGLVAAFLLALVQRRWIAQPSR